MDSVSTSVGGRTVTFSSYSPSIIGTAADILTNPDIGLAAGDNLPFYYAASQNGGAPLSESFFASTDDGATLQGTNDISVGILTGQMSSFSTGNSAASEILASDDTSATLINNNPNGSLIGFTGAGGNTLVGEGVVNAFQTGAGGSDAVLFDAEDAFNQLNSLTSVGQDLVLINAGTNGTQQTNVVTAANGGSDAITLLNGASLFFDNESTPFAGSPTSTLTGSDGSQISVSGPGAISVTAGGGTESFYVSTASGNVTLAGAAGGTDNFIFTPIQQGSTAIKPATLNNVDVVTNFTANDLVTLSGYGAASYGVQVVGGSTVLTLADHTSIVFAGISDPSLVVSGVITR